MLDKHRKRKPKDGRLGLKRSGICLSKYVDYRYYRFLPRKKLIVLIFIFTFVSFPPPKNGTFSIAEWQSRIYSSYAEARKGA